MGNMVKTWRGELVDMEAHVMANQNKRAIGNAMMNAKGDRIDKFGNVVKQAPNIDMSEYNRKNPKAVKTVALKDLHQEIFSSPAEALKSLEKPMQDKKHHPKRKIVDSEE